MYVQHSGYNRTLIIIQCLCLENHIRNFNILKINKGIQYFIQISNNHLILKLFISKEKRKINLKPDISIGIRFGTFSTHDMQFCLIPIHIWNWLFVQIITRVYIFVFIKLILVSSEEKCITYVLLLSHAFFTQIIVQHLFAVLYWCGFFLLWFYKEVFQKTNTFSSFLLNKRQPEGK